MNPNGTDLVNLTNHPACDANPAWSPDSSMIAFTTDRNSHTEVYVMNADGTNLVNLTKNAAADEEPAWLFQASH